ncbi:MAG: rhodanese-like domain-containing protein [Planctomycetota bacterium]|jgi:rhodanese-related sulfurtransferase/glyoxylase-like metal-dependent hydrolase (beta-lactamase superfamily II)
MHLKQYYLSCLAHASYLIADERTGVAAVVDPQRDIDQYIADAETNGWKIQYVFLTHFHADFLAGHIELREKTGAHIYLGARAEAEYDFNSVKDGDVVEFGDVRMKVLETPGHTPEGISILVYNLQESDTQPHSVLTGDTLFIGDVGRPDLLASIGVTADELADMLYDSVNRLKELPDATLVYPAHGAGSMCGKSLSNETVSTIGEQKTFNYALQPMSRSEFTALVTADQPEAPDYFVHDAILNRKDRISLAATLEKSLKPLSVDDVLRLQNSGAQLVDVRDASDYEGAHLRNSTNIALDGKYATWCGTVLSHDEPIVVVAEPGGEEEAVMRLGRIGFDNVVGYLENGMRSVGNRLDTLARTDRITAATLADRLESDNAPTVVDVRTEREWQNGHVDSSINIPLNHLLERTNELPRHEAFVVHCEGGYRSAIAASLLEQAGFDNVIDMVGGFKAWQASHLPATESTTASCSMA